jgi:hypothetical protein
MPAVELITTTPPELVRELLKASLRITVIFEIEEPSGGMLEGETKI